MEKLRINNGMKRIEVNDAGEYIEFSITDNGFFMKLAGLLQWLDGQQKEISGMLGQHGGIFAEDGDSVDFDALSGALDTRDGILKEACRRIDDAFGAESCRKIFGGTTPDFWAISDFLDQISPLIEKFAKERNAEIDGMLDRKYSKNRRGAKSPKPYQE